MEDNEALDQAKVRIASQFLLQSPPGEFNEVFNDVRTLLNNDGLLKKGCAQAIADYNKDQFVPVKIDGVEAPTMITKHNELKDGHFVDPKSGKVFKYDHLRKDATEVANSPPADVHEALESWRKTLQIGADDYIAKHYERTGVATVFVVGRLEVVLCIESHLFQPKNFWSGRWRSEWRIPVFDDDQHHRKVATLKCTGRIRLQVHYYEDGNVQQISNKNATLDLKLTAGDIATAAKDVIKAICENESVYQKAILESYATMSDTMFKALRRPLPITRSKFDWTKVQTYRIAEDIKQQPPQSMIIISTRYAILSLALLQLPCEALSENIITKLENDSGELKPVNSAAAASSKLKTDTEKMKLVKLVLPPTVETAVKDPSALAVKTNSQTNNETTAVAATPSEKQLDASQDGLYPIIFLFCVVLTIVAVMLVVRIIFSSKKRQFNTFGGNGFWTSRSSQSGGRLSLGGGPALGMPTGNISLGSGTAAYRAMPTQPSNFGHQTAVSEDGICDPHFDWERQFFEHTGDDDEEHLTTNMEVEPVVDSKLQLNWKN